MRCVGGDGTSRSTPAHDTKRQHERDNLDARLRGSAPKPKSRAIAGPAFSFHGVSILRGA